MILLALLTVSAATIGFQEAAPNLRPAAETTVIDSGTAVRVQPKGGRAEVGHLMRDWRPSDPALFLCLQSYRCPDLTSPDVAWVADSSVVRVEVGSGTLMRRGGMVGATIGLVAGLVLGSRIGDCSDCGEQPSAWSIVPVTTVVAGLVGAGIGALHPSWRTVAEPRRDLPRR